MSLIGCRNSTPSITVAESGVVVSDAEFSWEPHDWPMWRGPNGNGLASDEELPTTWGESKHVLWQTDLKGRGHGSPIVAGDLVVVATAVEQEAQQWVLAFDRVTGKKQWEKLIHEGNFPAKGKLHADSTHANGTLAYDGERLFVTFLNDDAIVLTALSMKGDLEWETSLGEFDSLFGYAPSPILFGSVVIVASEHLQGATLNAIDRATGKIAWRTNRERRASFSTPLVATIAGKKQLIMCGGRRVESFDPTTGEKNWSSQGAADYTCGTPVTDGENVYASGGNPQRETVCIKADGSGEVVWRNRDCLYEPSLIFANDLLFGANDRGVATCWSPKTGEPLWTKRLGGSFSASPIYSQGVIFVSNDQGKTFVFRATGSGYEEVAVNQLGDDTYASPAVSNGQLFYRVGYRRSGGRVERLVCISSQNSDADSVPKN